MEARRVVGEYELQEMVGKGTFAEVFRAAHLPTGARVAVKEIDRRRVDDYVRRGILQEMTILGSLSHPNILRLIHTIEVKVAYMYYRDMILKEIADRIAASSASTAAAAASASRSTSGPNLFF